MLACAGSPSRVRGRSAGGPRTGPSVRLFTPTFWGRAAGGFLQALLHGAREGKRHCKNPDKNVCPICYQWRSFVWPSTLSGSNVKYSKWFSRVLCRTKKAGGKRWETMAGQLADKFKANMAIKSILGGPCAP